MRVDPTDAARFAQWAAQRDEVAPLRSFRTPVQRLGHSVMTLLSHALLITIRRKPPV